VADPRARANRYLGWRALPTAEKTKKKAKKERKAVTPFFEYDVGNAMADTDLTFTYAIKEVRVPCAVCHACRACVVCLRRIVWLRRKWRLS
jgi:hypothetical protein